MGKIVFPHQVINNNGALPKLLITDNATIATTIAATATTTAVARTATGTATETATAKTRTKTTNYEDEWG